MSTCRALLAHVLDAELVGHGPVRRHKGVGTAHRQRTVADGSHQFAQFPVQRQHVVDNILSAAIDVQPMDEARVLRTDAGGTSARGAGVAAALLIAHAP